MLTPTAVSRALGVLGVIGFMALATTSSIATAGRQQDPIAPALPSFEDPKEPSAAPAPAIQAPPPPVDAAPAPREPEPLKDLPPAPEEPALDVAPPVEPQPKQPKAAPAAVEEPSNPLPPARELEPPPAAPAARVAAPEREPVRRTSASAEPAVDDPDARARTFVEKNQREADEQLKALREEAALLKSRLVRVEAGIRRWEALAEALDRSQERSSTQPRTGTVDGVPRTTRGGVQYIIPSGGPGVVIQSQPVTRADYVPAPLPR